MKKTMVFAIVLATMIIIMTSFNLQLAPTAPLNIPESELPTALYVCPAASSVFDPISMGFAPFTRFFRILLAFALMIYASLYGIQNKLELQDPADINLYKADADTLAKFEQLPGNLKSACSLANNSDFIKEHIPGAILEIYCNK